MRQNETDSNRLRWLYSGVLTLALAAPAMAGPRPQDPIYEIIAVPEATVNAVPMDGSEVDDEPQWLRQLLVGQATATGRRAAIERKLAGIVEVAPDGYRLQIEVSMPIALPSDVVGSKAAFRKGELVVARMQLLAEQGVPLVLAEATVRWRQVRWTTGYRVRRARPREAALLDAVELSVNRAMRRLVRMLHDAKRS